MDPNANLAEQLVLAKKLLDSDDDSTDCQFCDSAERLAELVQALNEWIRNGGFLPEVWKQEK
jgi:hypothetical protein